MSDWRQNNPNNRKKYQWDQNDTTNLNHPYKTNNSNNNHSQNNANNPSTSDNNKITPKPLTTLI